ncbi:MAG TPA: XdhC family protein, partial [Actinomycetota bacterium]|nr:XdhC family protein [Actinomycetota bacterium]
MPHALELLAGTTGAHPTGHGAASAADVAERPEEPPSEPAPRRVRATAVKIHGSPPCRLGNRVVIVPGGPLGGTLGCAEFDEAAIAIAPEVLRAGEPELRTLAHDLGEVDVLFEPELEPALLAIVSATDVARELQALGRRLGLTVALVEPRAERLAAGDLRLGWAV